MQTSVLERTKPVERPAIQTAVLVPLALVGIIAGGLILRVYGIGYGLPFLYHPDEPQLVNHAVGFFRGDFNPHFFNYPAAYMYLLYGVYKLLLPIGPHFGWFTQAQASNPAAWLQRDPTFFYLAARMTTAFLGTLTILMIFLIARRLYGVAVAILAAILMAVNPLHTQNSHYATVDVPMTAFLAISLYFIIRIAQGGRWWDYLLAGLFAGIATATKYPAALLFVPIILAHITRAWTLTHKPNDEKRDFGTRNIWIALLYPGLVLAGVTMILAFLAAAPYTILDFPAFWHDYTFEQRHMITGHLGREGGGPGWLWYAHETLRWGMEAPAFAAAIAGMLIVLFKKHRLIDWTFLAYPLVYYAIVGSWLTRFDRYMMPMMVFLTITAAVTFVAAGHAAAWLVRRSGRIQQARLASALVVILLAVPAIYWAADASAKLSFLMGQPDTRTLAREWIVANLKPDRITTEGYGLPLEGTGFRVTDRGTNGIGDVPAGTLLRQARYIITSSYVRDRWFAPGNRRPDRAATYRALENGNGVVLLHEFIPNPNLGYDPSQRDPLQPPGIEVHAVPFNSQVTTGPIIRIYGVK